jgi:preprotein translocase subunit SecE
MNNPVSGLIEYLKSSRAELMKVTWPSRRDTIRYSVLVIAVSILTAGFFAALDLGLSKGVEALLVRVAGTPTATNQPPAITPDVEATTADGLPADINVEPVPLEPTNN